MANAVIRTWIATLEGDDGNAIARILPDVVDRALERGALPRAVVRLLIQVRLPTATPDAEVPLPLEFPQHAFLFFSVDLGCTALLPSSCSLEMQILVSESPAVIKLLAHQALWASNAMGEDGLGHLLASVAWQEWTELGSDPDRADESMAALDVRSKREFA